MSLNKSISASTEYTITMATASSRQRFVQPPQKIMLTELQIKLNQRRDNSASPGGSPQFAGEKSLSGGDSPPTGSPKLKRPVVKSRSLSSGNRLKITASPKLGKKSQSKPILKAQTSKNERSTFAQSLSHSTTSRVNIEAIRDVVAVGDDVEIPPPAIRDIRPHTKSLGNAQVRHVAPPPTKPPPMLAASQKTAVKDTKVSYIVTTYVVIHTHTLSLSLSLSLSHTHTHTHTHAHTFTLSLSLSLSLSHTHTHTHTHTLSHTHTHTERSI